MNREKSDYASELVPAHAEFAEFDATMKEYARQLGSTPGLSAHVRQLRNRNQGMSHWLILAVFAGAVVALAMVQFAIR
jgi:hypothetical protein